MPPKKPSKLMEKIGLCKCGRPSSAASKSACSKAAVSKSILLNMPVEIIFMIVDFLHHRDRALLSLTCSALRRAVKLLPSLPATDTRGTRINYLFCLARDRPDCWVCEECLAVHELSPDDTPSSTPDSSCSSIMTWLLHDELFHKAYGFQLGHRHVQLAVKLGRLDPLPKAYKGYFKALMATYVGTATFPRSRSCTASHTVWPKVVAGRLLTLTSFEFRSREHPLTMSSIGKVAVCAHQRPRNWANRQNEPIGNPMKMSAALRIAFEFPNLPVRGYCAVCPVDFEVSWEHGALVVRAWTDFGTDESVVESSCWAAVVPNTRIVFPTAHYTYTGGTSRARYEGTV